MLLIILIFIIFIFLFCRTRGTVKDIPSKKRQQKRAKVLNNSCLTPQKSFFTAVENAGIISSHLYDIKHIFKKSFWSVLSSEMDIIWSQKAVEKIPN